MLVEADEALLLTGFDDCACDFEVELGADQAGSFIALPANNAQSTTMQDMAAHKTFAVHHEGQHT